MVYDLVARPAERYQGVERVGLHASGVVDVQSCPRATLLTLHTVTHFGPKFPFDDFQRFAAITAASTASGYF